MEIQPQAPKNGIFQKKFIFLKRFSNFASNEPSTTCRQSLSQVMQKNISKKLSLGLNFSTPSERVTSPSLKGSMVRALLLIHLLLLHSYILIYTVVRHKYSAP